MKRIIAMLCAILLIMTSLVACGNTNSLKNPEESYNKAMELLEEGDYEQAHRILYELGDYKDAKEYLKKFRIHFETEKANFGLLNGGSHTMHYEYDTNGNLISADRYRAREGLIEDYYNYEYEYDESGKITKIITINNEGKESITTYSYDANGKLIITDTEEYPDIEEYDENGNIIKKTVFDLNGNVFSISTYAYDESGKLSQVINFDEDGNETSKTEYEYTYDSKSGALISSKEISDSSYTLTEYDESENVIKRSNYFDDEDGKYYLGWEVEYDKYGKPLHQTHYTSDGKKSQRSTYEYDKNGNLTKLTYKDHRSGITRKFSWSDFVYFYYPDGVPEVTNSDHFGISASWSQYNLGNNINSQ